MPEQLTKHPEITLQVLRSSGAKCAEGAAQDILTQCPAQRFCKLPGGEICVFGLSDAPKMTQITAAEWRAIVPAEASEVLGGKVLLGSSIGLLAGTAIGLAAAHLWHRRH